jgi:hypothetical protein
MFKSYAEQFANHWLLVAENDYDTYRFLLEMEGDNITGISDELRQEWETLAEQVVKLVEEHISPIASEIIGSLIQGQGSMPFDIIARRVLEMKAEVANV